MGFERHDVPGIYTVENLQQLEDAYDDWKEAECLGNDALYGADLPEEGFPMVVKFERHEMTSDSCNVLEYL